MDPNSQFGTNPPPRWLEDADDPDGSRRRKGKAPLSEEEGLEDGNDGRQDAGLGNETRAGSFTRGSSSSPGDLLSELAALLELPHASQEGGFAPPVGLSDNRHRYLYYQEIVERSKFCPQWKDMTDTILGWLGKEFFFLMSEAQTHYNRINDFVSVKFHKKHDKQKGLMDEVFKILQLPALDLEHRDSEIMKKLETMNKLWVDQGKDVKGLKPRAKDMLKAVLHSSSRCTLEVTSTLKDHEKRNFPVEVFGDFLFEESATDTYRLSDVEGKVGRSDGLRSPSDPQSVPDIRSETAGSASGAGSSSNIRLVRVSSSGSFVPLDGAGNHPIQQSFPISPRENVLPSDGAGSSFPAMEANRHADGAGTCTNSNALHVFPTGTGVHGFPQPQIIPDVRSRTVWLLEGGPANPQASLFFLSGIAGPSHGAGSTSYPQYAYSLQPVGPSTVAGSSSHPQPQADLPFGNVDDWNGEVADRTAQFFLNELLAGVEYSDGECSISDSQVSRSFGRDSGTPLNGTEFTNFQTRDSHPER